MPPAAHNSVLFFWCPYLQGKNKVHPNLEPPMYYRPEHDVTVDNIMLAMFLDKWVKLLIMLSGVICEQTPNGLMLKLWLHDNSVKKKLLLL
jgi:hypothetical protein